MATKNTAPKPISPVAPPESSLQQFMRLQSTFAPKPIAPPSIPVSSGLPSDFFGSQEPLIPERMEAAPYQHDIQTSPIPEKKRPFGYKQPQLDIPDAFPQQKSYFNTPEPQQYDADDMMQEFRDTVLNPPQRTRMTYPDSTLGALNAALQVYNTPTDYEKNRVYVDGNAYQKASTYKDPVTGEQKFIEKYKQPSFMDQVMKAVPAGLPAVTDILNQPQKDAEADWKLKTEGLQKGIQAESQMALSQQRQAQASAIPQNLDIRRMDAQTRQYLASLKDIPESTRLQMLQDGRMDIATYNAVQAYERQILSGNQAMDRTVVGGQLGIARQGMANAGAMDRTQATIQGAAQRQGVAGQQALTQISAREQAQARLQQSQGQITAQQIAQRGELARRLQEQRAKDALVQKAAPGWSAVNQSNSQQKIALQDRAMEVANATPGLSEHITFNDQGFPVISAELDPQTASDAYEAIYGESPATNNINIPQIPGPPPVQQPQGPQGYNPPQGPQPQSPQIQSQPSGLPAPIQAPNVPAIPPAAGGISGGQGAILMTRTERDGRVTQRMVKPEHVEIAKSQGFK